MGDDRGMDNNAFDEKNVCDPNKPLSNKENGIPVTTVVVETTNDSKQYIEKTRTKFRTRVWIITACCAILAITVAITVPLCMANGCGTSSGEEESRTSSTTESTVSTTQGSTTTSTTTGSSSSTSNPLVRDMTVATKYGLVIGHPVPLTNALGYNKTIAVFNGVPFAKPPIGALRWQKPQEPDSWSSPLVAKSLRSLCIQRNLSIQRTHLGWDDFSEDCLYMNIFAPLDSSKDPYPVMVYIHGGAFQSNGAIKFPGHFLAEKDVVAVIIQYRVGIMGFASTDEPGLVSNFGLWDQIFALKFIQENIRGFGGDPDKVTIFGESAGAASSGHLILSPEAAGLFHQAILQSGSALSIWGFNGPDVLPETYLPHVAVKNDCPTSPNDEMLDCLRQIDPDILRLSGTGCKFCLGFAPVVDGVLIPDLPRKLRAKGEFHNIPIMVGYNADECNIFLPIVYPPILVRDVNSTQFETILRFIIDYLSFVVTVSGGSEQIQEAALFTYKPWPWVDDSVSNKKAMGQLCTDAAFIAPAAEDLYFHSQKATTYSYVNSVEFFSRLHPTPPWIGVPHMWELPYVFGYPQIQANRGTNEILKNDTGDLNNPLYQYNHDDELWSDFMITIWTNFVKYGDPTPQPLTPHTSNQSFTWAPYTNEKMEYLHLDNTLVQMKENNYRPLEASFWNNYLPWLGRGLDLHRPWDDETADVRLRKELPADQFNIDLAEVFDLAYLDQILLASEDRDL